MVAALPNAHGVVAGIDCAETARDVLDHAIAMAGVMRAPLTIVHALDFPGYVARAPPPALDAVKDKARAAVDAYVARARDAGATVDAVVRDGAAATVILDVAKERDASLVVVGTHGRHGMERAVLGSVAERLVRVALVPVLVIPVLVPRAAPVEPVASVRGRPGTPGHR